MHGQNQKFQVALCCAAWASCECSRWSTCRSVGGLIDPIPKGPCLGLCDRMNRAALYVRHARKKYIRFYPYTYIRPPWDTDSYPSYTAMSKYKFHIRLSNHVRNSSHTLAKKQVRRRNSDLAKWIIMLTLLFHHPPFSTIPSHTTPSAHTDEHIISYHSFQLRRFT